MERFGISGSEISEMFSKGFDTSKRFLELVREGNLNEIHHLLSFQTVKYPTIVEGLNIAIESKRMDIAEVFLDNSYDLEPIMRFSIRLSYLKVLDLLVERGVNFLPELKLVAKNNQMDTIKLLERHNTVKHFYYIVAMGAIEGGHLPLLRYSLSKGVDLDISIMYEAIEWENDTLDFLFSISPPNKDFAIQAIYRCKYLSVLTYIRNGGVVDNELLRAAEIAKGNATPENLENANRIISLLKEHSLTNKL